MKNILFIALTVFCIKQIICSDVAGDADSSPTRVLSALLEPVKDLLDSNNQENSDTDLKRDTDSGTKDSKINGLLDAISPLLESVLEPVQNSLDSNSQGTKSKRDTDSENGVLLDALPDELRPLLKQALKPVQDFVNSNGQGTKSKRDTDSGTKDSKIDGLLGAISPILESVLEPVENSLNLNKQGTKSKRDTDSQTEDSENGALVNGLPSILKPVKDSNILGILKRDTVSQIEGLVDGLVNGILPEPSTGTVTHDTSKPEDQSGEDTSSSGALLKRQKDSDEADQKDSSSDKKKKPDGKPPKDEVKKTTLILNIFEYILALIFSEQVVAYPTCVVQEGYYLHITIYFPYGIPSGKHRYHDEQEKPKPADFFIQDLVDFLTLVIKAFEVVGYPTSVSQNGKYLKIQFYFPNGLPGDRKSNYSY